MSVTIYHGRAGSGKTKAVYDRIQQVITDCPGEPIILLVPEPATYRVERELALCMPKGGFTTVRVVGFGRLAYQVYQSIGSARDQQSGISKLGRSMLLRLVMKRKEQELGLLGQAAGRPEFSSILQTLFTEFKAFRIGTDDLISAAERTKQAVLQKKLRELAVCMAAYEEELERHHQTDTDPIMDLVDALPSSPLMKDAHVFVDGFHWFTPVHYELLYTLFDLAKEAVITIDLPEAPEKMALHNKEEHLFSRPVEIYEMLAARYSRTITYRAFDGHVEDELLHALEADFFTSPALRNGTDRKVPLICGYNKEREADAVARDILSYIEADDAARYRDVCIMLRDSETYGDTLEKVLTRYGIPHFIDRQRPMKNHPLAELVSDLFGIVKHNYSRDTMFRLLKTDLTPLSREAVDELENYVLEFGIDHFLWEKDSWSYMRNAGAYRNQDNPDEPRRSRVNEARRTVMDILMPWFDFAVSPDGHTGVDWCRRIYELLEALEVPRRLFEWTEEAAGNGDLEEKASHEQMYNAVIGFLDELTILKDDVLTLDEMMLLFEEGLDDVHYSMIPPTLDHVVITTVERGYSQSWPRVYIMGLNQGVFPRSMGDEGLIKDRERKELAELGLVLAEGALPKAFNEQFLLYISMTRARRHLTLSYAAAGDDGESLESSLVVKRLETLGYCAPAKQAPLAIPQGREKEYLWRPYQSLSLLSERWGLFFSGNDIAPVWWGLYNWARNSDVYRPRLQQVSRGINDDNTVPVIHRDLVNGLFLTDGYMTGSVTRLEKYRQCPFKFYAQYGLKLEPRRIRTFGAPEIGTFLHANLERLGARLLAENKQWRDLDESLQEELCTVIADDILRENQFGEDESSAYQEAIQSRVIRTLRHTVSRLVEWSGRSDFNTVSLEQSFGRPGGWESVDVPLGDRRYMKLTGQIDRIDEYTAGGATYGMVIDYKSGNAGIRAQEVYYGLKLQLMTYLLALEQSYQRRHRTSVIPAAVVYTYVKNPRTSASDPVSYEEAAVLAGKNTTAYNRGYFSDNVEVLSHIDEQVTAQSKAKGPYVPIRITAKGDIHSGDRDYTKTGDDFHVMCRYTSHIMADAGCRIGAGEFPIRPYQLQKVSPCSYCEFRAVCRFDSSRNRYRYLTGLDEQTALDKMRDVVERKEGEDHGR